MSEEQNDSPAFRLRPRRAAPKSYYAVRLEYSANPAAFIRERPRTNTKRKTLAHKSGSYATKTTLNQGNPSPITVDKEEREREEKRMRLHRDTTQSITTNTMISPFIERIHLDNLEANSTYEHNYVTLQIKQIEQSINGRLIICECIGTENSHKNYVVNVHLFNEYANESLVKIGKIISIAKFKTGDPENEESETKSSHILPFNVIVRNDELVERATSNSNCGSTISQQLTSSLNPGGTGSVNRRLLVPFVSISDMIEQPIEPYVEMV